MTQAATAPTLSSSALAKTPSQFQYQPLMRVGGADGLQGLANAMKAKIAAALPRHITADRMLKALFVAASKNPKIFECTQESICKSLMDASAMGLDCSGTLGSGYLVPFKKNTKDGSGKWSSRMECQFMPGYRGLIDLARRGGQVADIQVHMVYAQDTWDIEMGTEPKIKHKPYLGADRREEYIVVYAVAIMRDGTKHPDYMTIAEINRVRDLTMAKNKSDEVTGPWKDHYVEMAKKTMIRRICKTLPLSPEIERAIAIDDENNDLSPDIQVIDAKQLENLNRTEDLADRLTRETGVPCDADGKCPPGQEVPDPATKAEAKRQVDALKKASGGDPNDPSTWEKTEDGTPIPPHVGRNQQPEEAPQNE